MVEGVFRKNIKGLIFACLGVLVVVILILNPIACVPAGHVGVKVLFGKVYPTVLTEGMHVINPLLSIKRLSVRTQEYTMSIAPGEGRFKGDDSLTALTQEGLTVKVDLTVWYRLNPERAPEVYQTIGENYDAIILRPAVRTVARDSIALYEAKDIYSEKRGEATLKLQEGLVKAIGARGIEIEKVLIRNVDLPPQLAKAIEDKLAAEQQAQTMKFVLQKEEQEAQRKKIEAKGIANAQSVIADSLTSQYLQWYYINTMKALVAAPNNTTVILPFDQKIIPLLPIKGK